jgi:group I intron endonuclease
MAFLVYCLTNRVTGKQYIGQTENLDRRLRQHNSEQSNCRALSSAIRKYGWTAFDVCTLASDTLASDIDLLEIQYIQEFKTLAPNGYNLVGGGRVPRVLSEETRRRKSESAKRVGVSQACHDAAVTPEARRKMSESAKKRGVSEACRAAHKTKVTGRKQSSEHISKRVKAVRGKKRPKQAESMNRFYTSEERKKQSARMTLWWAERKAACSS